MNPGWYPDPDVQMNHDVAHLLVWASLVLFFFFFFLHLEESTSSVFEMCFFCLDLIILESPYMKTMDLTDLRLKNPLFFFSEKS